VITRMGYREVDASIVDLTCPESIPNPVASSLFLSSIACTEE